MFSWFKKKNEESGANDKNADGPDFSKIDSKTKAEQLFKAGSLEKLYLFPIAFGGDETPPNTLFVPIGIAAIKNNIDENVIGEMLESGKVSQYSANPEYQGNSFIPTRINIRAYDPGEFTTTINIWGEALKS